MQFAHLIRDENSGGESLILSPLQTKSLSPIALLKARTLLSVLMDSSRLTFSSAGDGQWVMWQPSWMSLGPIPMTSVDQNVDAIIPAKLHAPAWDQTGVALIRNNMESHALFLEWLVVSRKYLKRNPDQAKLVREKLEETYPTVFADNQLTQAG